jgi:hypothetical protein
LPGQVGRVFSHPRESKKSQEWGTEVPFPGFVRTRIETGGLVAPGGCARTQLEAESPDSLLALANRSLEMESPVSILRYCGKGSFFLGAGVGVGVAG